MSIHFCAIDEDNFDTIIAMKRPEEEHFLAPNSVSLAQCWLYRNDGDVHPCAIYADEAPVGFLLLEEEARKLMLWRIMFPEEHANKGYGTAAIALLIRLARESGRYDALYLDCSPDNHRARHVYEKLGFSSTGDINYGDVEMKLDL